MTVAGTDIYARFQPGINFTEMFNAGERVTIVKMSNSTGPADHSPTGYVNGAHDAGFRVGGYHYAMGTNPTANADAFVTALLANPHAIDVAPALDYEDASLPTSAAGRRAWCATFFARLKARLPQLDQVMLYASGSVLAAMGASLVQVPGLHVLIWDAEYSANDGIQHTRHYWTGATAVHQYTSNGRVAGISQVVDRDAVYVDVSAVTNGGTPTPEDDVADTDSITYSNPGHTRGTAITGTTTEQDVLRRSDNWHRQTLDRLDDLSDLIAAHDGHLQALATVVGTDFQQTMWEVDAKGAADIAAVQAASTAVNAAIEATPAGSAPDATAVATALAPLLGPLVGAGATPEQIGAAVVTALAGKLA
jgi:GH25 family lysozyme M1 (1,4-beta-N-acetylmuramidase)